MNSSEFTKATINNSKVTPKSIYIFSFILLIILLLTFYFQRNYDINKNIQEQPLEKRVLKVHTQWGKLRNSMINDGFTQWKQNKISDFLQNLTPIVLIECLKNGTPPGAIIAISSLESGYGTGYVGMVTGNILSLNAKDDETALPALTLPETKEKVFIIDSHVLQDMLAKGYPFELNKRPPSFKKDYRPDNFRGNETFLDYFLHHPDEKYIAWKNNINDLLVERIKYNSSIPAYKETHIFTNEIKKTKSLRQLISSSSAKDFISLIGGKPFSFNSNPSWVLKSHQIIEKLGLDIFLKKYLFLFNEYYDLTEWHWDI